MRIPFDSFVLQAVVAELQTYRGAKLQEIRQPTETEVVLSLYGGGREAMLLISCHPIFSRAHLVTKRPANQSNPPQFLSALRSRLENSRLIEVAQVQGDRMLEFVFETATGPHRLIAELMGKHSNALLIDPAGRVLAAAKWVGRSKSSRPILPGCDYVLPPVLTGGEELKESPFYRKLTAALGRPPTPGPAVISPGHGAYPAPVEALGLPEHARGGMSIALEQYFDAAIPAHLADGLRASLTTQLERVIFAREVALEDLRRADAAGGRAPEWQLTGELILAYGPAAPPGSKTLQAWDYEGQERTIPLDPELDFKANANRFFERAKKAKARLGTVRDQIVRLAADRDRVAGLLERVQAAPRLVDLRALQDEAKAGHYLSQQAASAPKNKEDRPYEGHRIRELTGPGGWMILYGENAEANDYLTLRVAKPDDYWLHVRGGTSAHVVVVTRRQPDRVQRETLEYAARVAVLHSPSKHAGFVSVDYTLKKYVRKPKGAPKGTAHYTHEKTLHVES